MKLSNKRIINTNLGQYLRAVETSSHIYFLNFDESDENASVKMFDRSRVLISDNYFAYESLLKDLKAANYTWMSDTLKQHLKDKKIKTRKKKILVPKVGEVERIAYFCV